MNDVPRDTLCVCGGNPDDCAPAVRPVEVEIVDVEHRAAGRRVTRIRVTLSGLWTRGWREDLALALATAVFLFFDFLFELNIHFRMLNSVHRNESDAEI